ncbi:MAG: hypothetical protein IKR57_03500 [Bacilli bacterium]|nr:hypothetical protein [Bacilli bacterium]
MLKMIKGVKIDDSDKLNEEYMITENCIIANINANKILNLINDFINIQKDPLFLIIEVPSNEKNEIIEENIIKKFHKDVYYLDNMSKQFAKELIKTFGNLFINDGLSQIGIGNHISNAEIITDKYNVIEIFNGKDKIEKYEKLMDKHKIKIVEDLVTAWDFFSDSNQGECNRVDEDGKSVYDAIEVLTKEAGLYFAERRED